MAFYGAREEVKGKVSSQPVTRFVQVRLSETPTVLIYLFFPHILELVQCKKNENTLLLLCDFSKLLPSTHAQLKNNSFYSN